MYDSLLVVGVDSRQRMAKRTPLYVCVFLPGRGMEDAAGGIPPTSLLLAVVCVEIGYNNKYTP